MMEFQNSENFAKKMDELDPLKSFRDEFIFPTFTEKPIVYFTGNSLGLQPRNAAVYIQDELKDWATYGVEGHFLAKRPWYSYHEQLTLMTAKLVGAKPI